MNVEKIFALWDEDCKIDATQLQFESLKIPELHNRYYKIYISEKVELKRLKTEVLPKLQLEKNEFFTLGPTEETKAAGWELPARGKVLRQDLQPYLAADKQLIELNLKIGKQEEKIELLKSILETIRNRSYQIRAAIDFMKLYNNE